MKWNGNGIESIESKKLLQFAIAIYVCKLHVSKLLLLLLLLVSQAVATSNQRSHAPRHTYTSNVSRLLRVDYITRSERVYEIIRENTVSVCKLYCSSQVYNLLHTAFEFNSFATCQLPVATQRAVSLALARVLKRQRNESESDSPSGA